jgi:Iap family predicted aminopeptidase
MNLRHRRSNWTIFIFVLCLFASPVSAQRSPILERNVRAQLNFLASDAMQGRGSGTAYERIAAEYIAAQFRQFGLEPGGDTDSSGNRDFVQKVVGQTRTTWNVIGILRGSGRQSGSEVILLSAHLDHLGVNESLSGDTIFNGADDNASGCVAVLELARVLAAGKRPRRTIYFVGFGAEERGGVGSRYFVSQPPVPLTQIVVNINFEMLGRPDPKVADGTLWLTGYERSTLGPELVRRGASLVADPRPEQRFFQRSDNYTLALRGVVAHTISSFGLHPDYHRPSDEVAKIDFPFMTRSLNSLVNPIQRLANSNFRPAWLPGQAPSR